MLTIRLICIVAALLAASGLAQAELGPEQKTRLIGSLLTNHVIPRYAAFRDQAAILRDALKRTCQAGQPPGTDVVKSAFSATLAAWMQVQHIRFGPVMAKDRFYRVQFWPDKHGRGGKQLNRLLNGPPDAVPDKNRIARTSVALQGLPALERLIFTSPDSNDRRREIACRLASAITHNLVQIADSTLADWQAYKPADAAIVIEALVRNLVEQLQIILDAKLARPLGKSVKLARPKRAESWRSRNSLNNIRHNLQGMLELIGGPDGGDGLRLATRPAKEGYDIADAMVENLNYGIKSISGHPGSLAEDVTSPKGREYITFLIAHVGGLQELIVEHLAPQLGVNLGFNSQDGD